jgi:hypothetical protein
VQSLTIISGLRFLRGKLKVAQTILNYLLNLVRDQRLGRPNVHERLSPLNFLDWLCLQSYMLYLDLGRIVSEFIEGLIRQRKAHIRPLFSKVINCRINPIFAMKILIHIIQRNIAAEAARAILLVGRLLRCIYICVAIAILGGYARLLLFGAEI